MKLTDEYLDYLYKISKLNINKENKEDIKNSLQEVMDYFDIIDKLDFNSLDDSSYEAPVKPLREDKAYRDQAVVDVEDNGYLRVPIIQRQGD